MGNTVGRLSKIDKLNLAYVAGFLDGDGSIMLQIHRRESGKSKFRIKTVICFYQDSSHKAEIEWVKETLGCGYIYNRSDGICELRIEGFQKVFEVLSKLQPFLRFKTKQASLILDLIPKLELRLVTQQNIQEWVKKMRDYNYF